jgi:hypothetical protein
MPYGWQHLRKGFYTLARRAEVIEVYRPYLEVLEID